MLVLSADGNDGGMRRLTGDGGNTAECRHSCMDAEEHLRIPCKTCYKIGKILIAGMLFL